jgi:hypothetical protein
MSMEKRWPTVTSLVRREQRKLERATAERLLACGCPRCSMQLAMMGHPMALAGAGAGDVEAPSSPSHGLN